MRAGRADAAGPLGTAGDGSRRWTLPGGGMDHGEDPYDTVIREAEEETGYAVEPLALLGVDSVLRSAPAPTRFAQRLPRPADRLQDRVTGGELRHETNGSTDMAAWHPLDEVPALDRVALVDVGLRLWRERPPLGRVGSFGLSGGSGCRKRAVPRRRRWACPSPASAA